MILIIQNREVILDDADYDQICRFSWHISKGVYARRSYGSGVFMHNCILPKKAGFDVDHIDRNPLNNSRSNLRYVTRSENKLNSECTLRRKLPPRIYKDARFCGSGYVGKFCWKNKQYWTKTQPSIEEAQAALSALLSTITTGKT